MKTHEEKLEGLTAGPHDDDPEFVRSTEELCEKIRKENPYLSEEIKQRFDAEDERQK